MFKLEFDRECLWQWDLNQRLILTNVEEGVEVHFSHPFVDTIGALPVLTYKENDLVYANIPNELLQVSGYFIAYVYTCLEGDRENEAHTKMSISIDIKEREQPVNYEYSETEVLNYRKLVSEAKEIVEDTLNIIKEAYVSNKQTTGDFDIEQEAIIEKTLEFDLKGEPVEIAFAPTSIAWCSLINTSVEVTGNKAVVTLQIGGIGDTDSANVTGVCFYRLTKYDEEIISGLLDEINGEVI